MRLPRSKKGLRHGVTVLKVTRCLKEITQDLWTKQIVYRVVCLKKEAHYSAHVRFSSILFYQLLFQIWYSQKQIYTVSKTVRLLHIVDEILKHQMESSICASAPTLRHSFYVWVNVVRPAELSFWQVLS